MGTSSSRRPVKDSTVRNHQKGFDWQDIKTGGASWLHKVWDFLVLWDLMKKCHYCTPKSTLQIVSFALGSNCNWFFEKAFIDCPEKQNNIAES